MAGTIEWLTDWDEALRQASSQDKHVFLDFFNPQ